MELVQHSCHEHPLEFIQAHGSRIKEEETDSRKSEEKEVKDGRKARCYGCREQIEGPHYCCNTRCKFYLHKSCAELDVGSEINHPFHSHPLFLLPKPPSTIRPCFCSFCHYRCYGFVFHCEACGFFLDIKCAFLPLSAIGNLTQLQHFSHQHPLLLFENHNCQVCGFCAGCEQRLSESDAIYRCLDCWDFHLHKQCAELPLEINQPFHSHPLFLLPKPPYPKGYILACSFCGTACASFVYLCKPGCLGLGIKCGCFSSSIGEYPKLQHFLHEHSLVLVDKKQSKISHLFCAACEKSLSGRTIYGCMDCKRFALHKECAELPREINHPFHPPHPLILSAQSPCFQMRAGVRVKICRFCHGPSAGFVYRCGSCNLDLDIECAWLQLQIAGDFHKLDHFSHEHPLIFNEMYNKDDNSRCSACWKPVKSALYRCVDCYSFDLHKECAELPRETKHPCHRKHPLTLLSNRPTHPEDCSCYWCKVQHKGFLYYCSSCKFGLNLENRELPRTITDESHHEHPWVLLSVCISFICNFCGTEGQCAPYVCTICDLVVHKSCISLRKEIRTRRHLHKICHRYSLEPEQSEKLECRICRDEVDTEYGSYCCFATNCNYIAHVKCATDPANLLEDQFDRSAEGTLISEVIEMVTVGEDEIAKRIKHHYHRHYLVMTFVGDRVKYDGVCDGCMRNISVPFYSCKECEFFLHRQCAELPIVKQVAIHKHPLFLGKHDISNYEFCFACSRFHHGYSYICDRRNCDFKIDIQCSLLPDSLIHPSHREHIFLVTQEYQGNCNGCNKEKEFVYRCKECRGFALCFECMTLPPTAWYKYDKHPLSLAYYDDSDQHQLCCDLCEEERHRNHWFYCCADCDNSVHIECVLGDLPFIRLKSHIGVLKHRYVLQFVQKVWDSPPCHVCGKLCRGQALECTNEDCKQIFHFKCIAD